jgi:hypothetical protein
MSRGTSYALLALLLAACGGSKAQPAQGPPLAESSAPEAAAGEKSSDPSKSEADEVAGASEGEAIPTKCVQKGDACVPPESFVKRLCLEAFPNVALNMFRKGTPWTRAYLTRKTNAWNASGGASDNIQLEFDEEVLILRHRVPDKGGMQVSGASGGYDALRWDGACVTLAKEELTLRLPPQAKSARIEWRWLDDPIQEKLRADGKVDDAYKKRRNECKGASMGTVSLKCVKADARLSEVIVQYVRDGGELATPAKLP